MRIMEQECYTGKGRIESQWELPVEHKLINKQQEKPKNIRIAAYCRVSTELDEQTDSFELQEFHYTSLILNTPGWRLAGIYTDQGITGTQRSQRIGFKRMIRHCKEGKIDIVICKSVSRFARNTLDLLETVRILKELNIRVIFEKEGIDTLSVRSEFILSTIAAIAQEESRSISENMGWSFKKRFQSGIPVFKRILGYDIKGKGAEKKIVINEEEANIVREIYDLAINGIGYTAIARIMMKKGYKTAAGKSEWIFDYIKGILTNERYTGDVLCQKTYTTDFLTHERKNNMGERQQYLIENHHQGIIKHEIFNEVQKIVAHNKTNKTTQRKSYPLSSRITCGHCGANYSHQCYYGKVNWRCRKSSKNSNLCKSKSILETQLESIILKAFKMRYDLEDENFIHKIKLDIKRLQDNDNIEYSRSKLKRELTEALKNELNSENKDDKADIKKSTALEEKLKDQEHFWSLIEEDRKYRSKTLEWLDKLPYGEKRTRIFFEQFNIEYMRAWVIGIKVLSPTSFIIRWFDNTETIVKMHD